MGTIITSSVASLGSGYIANQTIAVNQGGNKTAVINILTVDGSGVPLTYFKPEDFFPLTASNVNQAGCGYSAQNGVPTYNVSSPGSGFVLDILSVGPGSDATHGPLFDAFVNVGGSGYALHDTGRVIQGANNSSVYKVTQVFGGVVFGVTFGFSDGYALGDCTTTPFGPQPGSGSGLIVTRQTDGTCSFASTAGYRNRTFGGPSKQ